MGSEYRGAGQAVGTAAVLRGGSSRQARRASRRGTRTVRWAARHQHYGSYMTPRQEKRIRRIQGIDRTLAMIGDVRHQQIPAPGPAGCARPLPAPTRRCIAGGEIAHRGAYADSIVTGSVRRWICRGWLTICLGVRRDLVSRARCSVQRGCFAHLVCSNGSPTCRRV